MTHFVDDGYLDTTCSWCGKPAADGEKVEILSMLVKRGKVDAPQLREALQRDVCKKDDENFYAVEVMKFVRGEASGIKPGTVGETRAKIAKDLIAKNPSLALPENLQGLIAAVEAVEQELAVAAGQVITLSDEEMAMCELVARERVPPSGAASDRAGRMPAPTS